MANKSSIKLESDGAENCLAQLKEQVDQMNSIFEDIKSHTDKIKNDWQGKLSSANLQSFENFSSVYETINTRNKKYTDFLNYTIENYKTYENLTNKAIDDGKQGLSINDSDK